MFDTSPILTTIGAGPTAFLLSETIYLMVIGFCCHDIDSYQTFRNKLYECLGDIAHDVTSGTMAIVRLCFWDSNLEGNRDSESGGRQTENQASLPPPYWVSPLLFHCVLFRVSLHCLR